MGRTANFGASRWFKHSDTSSWDPQAACRGDNWVLPWAGDFEPLGLTANTMKSICHSCPVRATCAEYALTCDGIGVGGGYYAGVFIPWAERNSQGQVVGGRESVARNRARTDLRRILRTLRPGRDDEPEEKPSGSVRVGLSLQPIT